LGRHGVQRCLLQSTSGEGLGARSPQCDARTGTTVFQHTGNEPASGWGSLDTTSIKVTFLGGASSIGASCTLLEAGATRILIDCGLRLHGGSPLPDLSVLSGARLDAILLTHAHTDHSGALPVLAEAFPGVQVLATPPSIDLTTILLNDSTRRADSAEQEGEIPLYSRQQVERLLALLTPVHHGESRTIGDVTATFLPASHILGASMVHLATPSGAVLFTGDYSVTAQRTVPALSTPTVHADMVITESTYGNRLHEDRSVAEERLVQQIRVIVENNGRVLIPAFAIGRAQEVIRILRRAFNQQRLPKVPVFIDGMVRSVCDVYASYPRYVTRALEREITRSMHPFYDENIRPVRDRAERAGIMQSGACVVVASSGMLNGGASVEYAREFAQCERDAILLTGYQDEESPGRALLDLAGAAGPQQIRLGAATVPLRCHVEKYGLSAHADRMQMAGLVNALSPRTVVLVHGDADAKTALAGGMTCRDVVMPEDGATLLRTFPVRRSVALALPRSHAVTDLDVDTARRLLGPPQGVPVQARRVCEAWLGRRATPAEIEKCIAALTGMNLVRRDDERRRMLWVLKPEESGADPQEAALADRLRQENPKGRLLEFCMRRRIDAPEPLFVVDGAHFVTSMSLSIDGVTLDSGPQKAGSKKTSEQCAAAALLQRLERHVGATTGSVTVLDEQTCEQLKRDNPKGRLIEFCSSGKLPYPAFETRPVTGGFQVTARIDGKPSGAPAEWFQAPTLKSAERGAARHLLAQLRRGTGHPDPSPVTDGAQVPVATDARGALNEMRQTGALRDYGYTDAGQEGPNHQPVFRVRGWAEFGDGRRVETETVSGSSKKDAQRRAADALRDALSSEPKSAGSPPG